MFFQNNILRPGPICQRERGNTKGRDGPGPFLVRDRLRCFRNVPRRQSWTNKAREHKKAQEEHNCGQIAPHVSAKRLRCVDVRLCQSVGKQARTKVAMRCTHCVRMTGLHVLPRSRSDQPPCKDSAGRVRPVLPLMDVTLW